MNQIEFLKWIAKGFNPYTGEKFSNEDILRNPDVVARLYELAIELSEFKNKPNRDKVKAYKVDAEIIQAIQIIEPETTISYVAANIAIATLLGKTMIMKKIREYLVANGYLEYLPEGNDKSNKRATALGESIGIKNVQKTSQLGTVYTNVYYNVEAQKFIISKLPEILN